MYFRDYFIHYVFVLIRLAWLSDHFRGLGHGYALSLALGNRSSKLAIRVAQPGLFLHGKVFTSLITG